MAGIHEYILNYNAKSYADAGDTACLLDCSLGVNREPIPAAVLKAASEIPEEDIKFYPHDEEIIHQIVEKFSRVADLHTENVWIGNGSYDLLCNINIMYVGKGKKVFSYAPQFSANVDFIHCIGADYCYYPLNQAYNYRFSTEEFIEQMKQSNADLVCVENPNNPTGQIIQLSEIEKIVETAEALNMEVVVDEAYGDYMELNNSAICLIGKYSNLFVTRSFSKGYGMAGIRMGYAFGSKPAITQLKKLVSPFNCSNFARYVAKEMISDTDFIQNLLLKTRQKKELLLTEMKKLKHIIVAETNLTTPILLLYTKNEKINLYEELQDCGLSSVSGLAYDNLSSNAVRIMVCEKMDLLIQLLKKADSKLNSLL